MEGAMLSRAVCGHQFALAPLPLCRTYESRSAAIRPQKTGRSQLKLRCGAAKDADELQLVKREETNDGAILFVFGDEAAAAAHQKESPAEPESPAQPESKPAEPKPIEQLKTAATSPPAESKSAAEEVQSDSQPKAAYEKRREKKVKGAEPAEASHVEASKEKKTRSKKVKEAVVEAEVEHGAETSVMVDEAHQDAVLSNGALLPDFEDDEDPDELLSDEDAPDLQDEIAKTLTSLKVKDLKEMCKERKIKGYSSMRKSQLVRTLKPILAEEM